MGVDPILTGPSGPYCAWIFARSRLTDRDALDVEDQVRVRRNVRGSTLLAVSHRRRDGKTTLAPGGHASDTDVPTLDDLTDTKLEREWLALLVGCVFVSHGGTIWKVDNLQSKTLPFFSLPM